MLLMPMALAGTWSGEEIERMGGAETYPLAVNETDEAAGYGTELFDTAHHAFSWAGGTTTKLPDAWGNAYPYGMSEDGVVAGLDADHPTPLA